MRKVVVCHLCTSGLVQENGRCANCGAMRSPQKPELLGWERLLLYASILFLATIMALLAFRSSGIPFNELPLH